MTKTEKDVPTGRRSDRKKQMQFRNSKNQQTADMEEKSKVDADSTSTIDQKFKDLKRLMNARFTEVLNSLQQKNETVKQDVGIEKQNDIVVEEIQPLESIISGREHDLTLTIYKPPSTTPAEYETSDTAILSAFSTPKKNMSADKNAPVPRSRKPSKIYHSPLLIYFGSNVAKDLTTQDASARTDEVADMEMSLINTIEGLSTCAGQPWHMVNEVFVPINYDGVFHWVLAVIALKDLCILVYDSMASSRKRKQTSEIEKDCGVFVVVYAEYLSEGLGISCSGIDAQYHHLRYASLLCKYEFEKAENGYFSENDDPPRSRSKFAPKEIDRVLHIK
ncbi:hypothetical protein CQW23_22481 [Capsicum baccatum]|uniref:Ubiquitin-like protease family profile domain-containing protein n=1 Tax=Capsicum baccatum TaxID=33114 RepID=A0A2G2W101_CAPBA|nr:hypothetical protein CQW23_22481 [Capsicum baccatum]